MRILFTLHNFLPEPMFGAERVCLLQMRHFIKAGHTVGLFYAGREDVKPEVLKKEGLEGLHLFRVNYLNNKAQVLLSIWKPHVTTRFEQAIRSFKPDIAIFHHLVRLSLNLPSVARKYNVQTVYYLHDHYPVCPSYSLFDSTQKICREHSPAKCVQCLYESRFNRKLPTLLIPIILPMLIARKKLVEKLIRDTDLFISPSKSVLSELERQGLSLRQTMVIPHSANVIDKVQPYKLHTPLRFGYIGNMNIKKGINVLVDAFPGARSKSLIIRGFEDQSAIDEFKKSHSSFEAKLEQFSPDIAGFYREIDVLVVPSICLENQPTVILEAFSFGKPVVCSRIGGIEEIVKPGIGGLLFNPGDSSDLSQKVEHLIKNPSELLKLAECIPRLPTTTEYISSIMNAVEALLNNRAGKS